jgi:hypothetical protein
MSSAQDWSHSPCEYVFQSKGCVTVDQVFSCRHSHRAHANCWWPPPQRPQVVSAHPAGSRAPIPSFETSTDVHLTPALCGTKSQGGARASIGRRVSGGVDRDFRRDQRRCGSERASEFLCVVVTTACALQFNVTMRRRSPSHHLRLRTAWLSERRKRPTQLFWSRCSIQNSRHSLYGISSPGHVRSVRRGLPWDALGGLSIEVFSLKAAILSR